MTIEEVKRLDALLLEYAEKLNEHCDCIQILASVVTPEGTRTFFKGTGNWYSRQGMAHEFIKRDEAQTVAREIQQAKEDAG